MRINQHSSFTNKLPSNLFEREIETDLHCYEIPAELRSDADAVVGWTCRDCFIWDRSRVHSETFATTSGTCRCNVIHKLRNEVDQIAQMLKASPNPPITFRLVQIVKNSSIDANIAEIPAQFEKIVQKLVSIVDNADILFVRIWLLKLQTGHQTECSRRILRNKFSSIWRITTGLRNTPRHLSDVCKLSM